MLKYLDFILEKKVPKSERIKLYQDNRYVVVAPLTHKASCKYGANSNWCTAVLDSEYIWTEAQKPPNKDKNSILVYIIDRKAKKSEKQEKLQYDFKELVNQYNNGERDEEDIFDDMDKIRDNYEKNMYLDLSQVAVNINGGKYNLWSGNNIDLSDEGFLSLYNLPFPEKVLDAVVEFEENFEEIYKNHMFEFGD